MDSYVQSWCKQEKYLRTVASFSFEQLLLDSVGQIIICDAILEANVLSPEQT